MNKTASLTLAIGAAICIAPLTAQGTPHPDLDRAHHVLRRITFGPNKALVAQLRPNLAAVQSYIAAQLNPPAPSANNYHGSQSLNELLTGTIVPGTKGTLILPNTMGGLLTQFQVSAAQFAYALESEWQLREVMTQFWERHFNTNLVPGSGFFKPYIPANADMFNWGWWFEWEANKYYREHCLTNFHQLLHFTSRHASMMIYLHMPQNDGSKPNEDYARELLELYTVSPEYIQGTNVLSNYTQQDVENVARILTGWDVHRPTNQTATFAFQFDNTDHNYSSTATTLLTTSAQQITITQQSTPNGEQEGLELLSKLAGHPSTRAFVCRKLIAYFVDEALAALPTSPLLTAMENAWGSNGNIKAVLTAMFTHSDFLGATHRLKRVRIPLESIIGTARAMEAKVKQDASNLADPNSMWHMMIAMAAQGQTLQMYPAPNGYPTANFKQLSPTIGLQRAYWAWDIFLLPNQAEVPETDVVGFVSTVQPPLPTNPTRTNVVPHLLAVVDHMLESFYGSNYTLDDEVQVVNAITGAIAYVDAQTSGPVIGPWDPANATHYWVALTAAASSALGFIQGGMR